MKPKSPAAVFFAMKASRVPDGGWNSENFRTQNGIALIADIVRVKRATQAKGIRVMSGWLLRYWQRKLNEIIEKAVQIATMGRKAIEDTIDIDVPNNADLWGRAIQAVLAEDDLEVSFEVLPMAQSVASQSYSRIGTLFGTTAPANAAQSIQRRAQGIAQQVTRINDTTRKNLATEISTAMEEGLTVTETAHRLRERFPQIAANRIPTIARTEMGRAADEGVKQGLIDSGFVISVSVIGCEAIEPGIPTYKGKPTCNIENVPIEDVDKLEFHPNHTGCIVPSKMRGEDGSAEDIGPLSNTEYPEIPAAPKPKVRHNAGWLFDGIDETLIGKPSADDLAVLAQNMKDSKKIDISPSQLMSFVEDFNMDPWALREQLVGALPSEMQEQAELLIGGLGDKGWNLILRGPIKDDGWSREWEIFRTVDIGAKKAKHDLFHLPETSQAKGVARAVMQSNVELYDHLGINEIELSANIDIGGYAWARYGFIPDQKSWRVMRAELKDWIDARDHLPDDAINAVNAIVGDDSPTAIRRLAALQYTVEGEKLGKSFLLGRTWEGSIDLSVPEDYDILMQYVQQ